MLQQWHDASIMGVFFPKNLLKIGCVAFCNERVDAHRAHQLPYAIYFQFVQIDGLCFYTHDRKIEFNSTPLCTVHINPNLCIDLCNATCVAIQWRASQTPPKRKT